MTHSDCTCTHSSICCFFTSLVAKNGCTDTCRYELFGCGDFLCALPAILLLWLQNKVQGEVECRQVHFNYPTRPNIPVLKGIDMEVRRGRTVALVGSSGCGKSTIIQLVERFYDPKSGQVVSGQQ